MEVFYMSMIEKLGGGSLMGTATAVRKKTPEAAQDAFSAVLQQMKTGGGAPRGEKTGDRNEEETTTVTKVMADGSVLVTVYRGTEIISENKTKATTSEKDMTVISMRTEQSGGTKETEMNSASPTLGAAMLLRSLG